MHKDFSWSTTECVSSGHPDKVADQISDAVLDECLRIDPNARVACETLIKGNKVVLAGEITLGSTHKPDYDMAVRKALREAGYAASTFEIENLISAQSVEIKAAVDNQESAGDQGIMFGYATNETPTFIPKGMFLAKELINALDSHAAFGSSHLAKCLRPDAKTQITFDKYSGQVSHVVISTCHSPELSLEDLREGVRKHIVPSYLEYIGELRSLFDNDTHWIINQAGSWTIGGPEADCGLTGRKIVVDAYGPDCEVGGGAYCISGDTLIPTTNGLVQMAKANSLIKETRVKSDVGHQPFGRFWKNGIKKTMKLVTDHGYELEATPDHRIRVVDNNGNYVWKMISEITEKDWIPIQRSGRQFGNIVSHSFEFRHKNGTHRKWNLSIPKKITPAICELMGTWVGDGNGTGEYISIAVNEHNKEAVNYLKRIIKDSFGVESTQYGHRVQLSSLEARAFLEYLGCTKKRAWNKTVPHYIWNTTKENVAAFLRGCFETDGTSSISGNRHKVAYTTTSQILAKEIQQLLLNFGIVSKISCHAHNLNTDYIKDRRIQGKRPIYIVALKTNKSLTIFEKEIGFGTSRKMDKLSGLTTRDPYDRIPQQMNRLRFVTENCMEHTVETSGWCRFLRTGTDSKKNTKQASYFAAKRIVNGCIKQNPEIDALNDLISMDHFYVKMAERTESVCEVYDIEIPTNHTFVANGFVVHNSGKDPSKVDRSAAYAARFLAKNIVMAGVGSKCKVGVSYVIGKPEPLSVDVIVDGVSRPELGNAMSFKPADIISRLKLRSPIYLVATQNGPYGMEPYSQNGLDFFPWERQDEQLSEAIKSLEYFGKKSSGQ